MRKIKLDWLTIKALHLTHAEIDNSHRKTVTTTEKPQKGEEIGTLTGIKAKKLSLIKMQLQSSTKLVLYHLLCVQKWTLNYRTL